MTGKASAILVLFLLILPAGGLAKDYYSINDLQKQAEMGWHHTYSAYGKEINVDLDIKIPAVDTAPVIKVEYATLPSQTVPSENGIRYESITPARILMTKNFDIASDVIPETEGRYSNALLMQDAQAPDNPLSFRDAVEIAKIKLSDIGVNPNEFTFDEPYELHIHGYYYQKTHETALPGSYYFFVRQQLNDIPILMNAGSAYLKKTTRCFYPQVICNVRSSESWNILIETVVQNEMIAKDIPLCSIHDIIETVEAEILAGKINEIFALEFGYIVYDDPNTGKVDGFPGLHKEYYIVPGWVVSCIYNDNPKKSIAKTNTFEREKDGYLTAIINAQTAEMVNYKYNKKDKAEYKGFITWDEAERK